MRTNQFQDMSSKFQPTFQNRVFQEKVDSKRLSKFALILCENSILTCNHFNWGAHAHRTLNSQQTTKLNAG